MHEFAFIHLLLIIYFLLSFSIPIPATVTLFSVLTSHHLTASGSKLLLVSRMMGCCLESYRCLNQSESPRSETQDSMQPHDLKEDITEESEGERTGDHGIHREYDFLWITSDYSWLQVWQVWTEGWSSDEVGSWEGQESDQQDALWLQLLRTNSRHTIREDSIMGALLGLLASVSYNHNTTTTTVTSATFLILLLILMNTFTSCSGTENTVSATITTTTVLTLLMLLL